MMQILPDLPDKLLLLWNMEHNVTEYGKWACAYVQSNTPLSLTMFKFKQF